jgi:hypothetical protein
MKSPWADERSYNVARTEGVVGARHFALDLRGCDHDACRQAIEMAVSELAENIVKYSDGRGTFAGSISIATGAGVTRISASNPVTKPGEANAVAEVVATLRESSDPGELYRRRLADLLMTPELPRAQLGLLRIAYEGRFRLRADYDAAVLHIIAERTCAAD